MAQTPKGKKHDDAIIALLKSYTEPLSRSEVFEHAAMRKYRDSTVKYTGTRLNRMARNGLIKKVGRGLYAPVPATKPKVAKTKKQEHDALVTAMLDQDVAPVETYAEYSMSTKQLELVAPGMRLKLFIKP